MQNLLEKLLDIQRSDYDAHFSHIEYRVACDEPPTAVARLDFVKADASGEPRFRELASLLAQHITHYCFNAERRRDLSERDRNEMWMQARDLFRLTEAMLLRALEEKTFLPLGSDEEAQAIVS